MELPESSWDPVRLVKTQDAGESGPFHVSRWFASASHPRNTRPGSLLRVAVVTAAAPGLFTVFAVLGTPGAYLGVPAASLLAVREGAEHGQDRGSRCGRWSHPFDVSDHAAYSDPYETNAPRFAETEGRMPGFDEKATRLSETGPVRSRAS